MALVLGLDPGSNSIGWTVFNTDNGILHATGIRVLPLGISAEAAAERQHQRAMIRVARRKAQRTRRLSPMPIGQWALQQIERKQAILSHLLLGLLFATFILMAGIEHKNFQFWFNLAITVLIGWITIKKSN